MIGSAASSVLDAQERCLADMESGRYAGTHRDARQGWKGMRGCSGSWEITARIQAVETRNPSCTVDDTAVCFFFVFFCLLARPVFFFTSSLLFFLIFLF